MLLRIICIIFTSIFLISTAIAQDSHQEINDNKNDTTSPTWEPNPEHDTILDEIASAIGSSALNNITNSEQVFCYQIANKPENYTGYTINGMAIVGFCGVINPNLQTLIKSELMMNPDNIMFDVTENCVIRPQIMLRFIRGIDSTDVLLSSPCHALAIFYGGKISAFNAKPAAQIIDAIIDPLIKNKVDFASPALFNQLLPIGVAQTEEQKALQQKKNEPIKNWQTKQQNNAVRKSGWNKLKK
ncbi:MAG: hypothetical protein E7017_05295 [Alphaproteobacteria bacterium]|nr:hypothetical protein [Alphaproteobacteria bacterium]